MAINHLDVLLQVTVLFISIQIKGALYSPRRSLEVIAKHSLFQIITGPFLMSFST